MAKKVKECKRRINESVRNDKLEKFEEQFNVQRKKPWRDISQNGRFRCDINKKKNWLKYCRYITNKKDNDEGEREQQEKKVSGEEEENRKKRGGEKGEKKEETTWINKCSHFRSPAEALLLSIINKTKNIE